MRNIWKNGFAGIFAAILVVVLGQEVRFGVFIEEEIWREEVCCDWRWGNGFGRRETVLLGEK